jgi:hypothetical protein
LGNASVFTNAASGWACLVAAKVSSRRAARATAGTLALLDGALAAARGRGRGEVTNLGV